MSELFLQILNMSISASWLALVVLAARLLLKKAPKWVCVLLWGIVAVRLACPFTIESILSLLPSGETIPPDILFDPTPTIQSGIPVINEALNPIITETFRPVGLSSVNPLQVFTAVAAQFWLLGMMGMALHAVVSYLKLRTRVRTAVKLTDNIYQSEAVASPFVLGLIKPRIYLPFDMAQADMTHVIAHEQAHIRRRDHWWKPMGFALLTLHWFNPLMWLAYILLCRDIELACDEKVIKELGTDQRADYSQALLSCSVNRARIAACPLAFGEVGVKARVKSVLNYKKPAFWIIVIAVILCVTVAVCFLTDPVSYSRELPDYTALDSLPHDYTLEQAAADGCVIMVDGDVTSGKDIWLTFLRVTRAGQNARIRYIHHYSGKGAGNSDGTVDQAPQTYIHDLVYNGRQYTGSWYEGGEKIEKTYRHMLHLATPAEREDATYLATDRYVLTNDPNVSWNDIWNSILSSAAGVAIDHLTVYTDYLQEGDDLTDILPEGKLGVQDLTAETTGNATVTLRLPYNYISGYWGVYLIGQNEPEYTSNGEVPYDGALGKYRMAIRFGDTEATPEFTERFPVEQVVTLMKASSNFGSDLKVKVTYPNDHGFWIYIGSDVPFTTQEQVHQTEQLEGTLQIPVVEVAQDETSPRRLTLSDVILLAGKGDDLTWEDLDAFLCKDVGSGIVLLQYNMDGDFYLLVSGITDTPGFLHLYNETSNSYIDLRTDDIWEALLSHSVSLANKNFCAVTKAEISNGTDTVSITDPGLITGITNQLRSLSGTCTQIPGSVDSSNHGVCLTFSTGDRLTLFVGTDSFCMNQFDSGSFLSYRLESDTGKSITAFLDEIMKSGNVQTPYPEDRIAALFDTMIASYNPYNQYGFTNTEEYRELINYGLYTLRYCFTRFLEGEQPEPLDLMMEQTIGKILHDLGEWNDYRSYDTPEEWFFHYCDRVQTLSANVADSENFPLYHPAMALLLELMAQ